MPITLTTTLKNDMLALIKTAVESGAGAGKLRIYDGTKPAGPATAITTQVLLAEFTLADPAFATPSGGSMVLDADPDISDTANATGTATWGRVLDSDNNAHYDGVVDDTGTPDFTIDNQSITIGQTVNLVSGTLSI